MMKKERDGPYSNASRAPDKPVKAEQAGGPERRIGRVWKSMVSGRRRIAWVVIWADGMPVAHGNDHVTVAAMAERDPGDPKTSVGSVMQMGVRPDDFGRGVVCAIAVSDHGFYRSNVVSVLVEPTTGSGQLPHLNATLGKR